MAEEMARKYQEKTDKEDEKKEVVSQFKALIETLENECKQLANRVRNRYEYRSVKCEIVHGYNNNEVQYYRLDIGELTRKRQMTVSERQGTLEGVQ